MFPLWTSISLIFNQKSLFTSLKLKSFEFVNIAEFGKDLDSNHGKPDFLFLFCNFLFVKSRPSEYLEIKL